MLTLKIDNKTFKVTSLLSEIPLYEGIQCIEMILNNKNNDFNDKLNIVSMITGINIDLLIAMKESSVIQIYDIIYSSINMDKEFPIFKSFILNDVLYGLIDLNKITTYEFLDLNYQITSGTSQFDNLDKIIAILYRKVIRKKTNLKNILNNIKLRLLFKSVVPQVLNEYEIEEYNEECLDRNELFGKKLDTETSLGILALYMNYRNKIINDYNLIDNKRKLDPDQFDDGNPDACKSFEEENGWMFILNEISNNNIIERDIWLKKPVTQFLTQLNYLKNKRMSEIENNKKRNIDGGYNY